MRHNGRMKIATVAFDKASVRSFDADGRMHVAKTPISKAAVNPYYGSEIPGSEALGLEPKKIYKLYRDPDELAKGAATFNNLPLLRRHIQVSADDPKKDDVVGSIGSDTVFESPYLCSSLCIWDAEAIALVEAEKLDELSSAYRYVADMTPGTSPDGEAYDGVMRDIQANHLALVSVGRAGPDVVVADESPFPTQKELPAMKKTKLGHALIVALSAASPKIAQDSTLLQLLGGAVKSSFNKATARPALIAMDADIAPEKLDEIIDAVLGVEQDPEPTIPKAVDAASPEHAKIIDFLKSKGLDAPSLEAVGEMLRAGAAPAATDGDLMTPTDVDAKVATAMDGMRVEFRALEAAKSAVRTTVGDVIGMDSAEQVFRFALDHMKIDHKDMPAAGLGRLFAVASAKGTPAVTPNLALDSAAVAAKVPGLDRFRTI